MHNDPGFIYHTDYQFVVNSRKTGVDRESSASVIQQCPIHNTNHTQNECRGFRMESLTEQKNILRAHNLCFRCCESDSHIYPQSVMLTSRARIVEVRSTLQLYM